METDLLGGALADITDWAVENFGNATLVNNVETKAFWQQASAANASQFTDPEGNVPPIWEVQFSARVLQAPYSLKNNSAVFRKKYGWHGVVRRIDPPDVGDTNVLVSCLVELLTVGRK